MPSRNPPTTGDTMRITITLANPTERMQSVYFVWRLDISDYDLQYPVMTAPFSLTPGSEQTFTIPLKVGDYGVSFDASWHVAFYNATTFAVISEDTAYWRYVPAVKTQGEMMPEAIADNIRDALVGMEIDGDASFLKGWLVGGC